MLPPPDLSPPEILPGAAGSSRADGSRFERPSLEGFKLPQLPQRQPRSPAGPTQPHTVAAATSSQPSCDEARPHSVGTDRTGSGRRAEAAGGAPEAALRRPVAAELAREGQETTPGPD